MLSTFGLSEMPCLDMDPAKIRPTETVDRSSAGAGDMPKGAGDADTAAGSAAAERKGAKNG